MWDLRGRAGAEWWSVLLKRSPSAPFLRLKEEPPERNRKDLCLTAKIYALPKVYYGVVRPGDPSGYCPCGSTQPEATCNHEFGRVGAVGRRDRGEMIAQQVISSHSRAEERNTNPRYRTQRLAFLFVRLNEEIERLAISSREFCQFRDVDPALSGFALGYERLRASQESRDFHLCQTGFLTSLPQLTREVAIRLRVGGPHSAAPR